MNKNRPDVYSASDYAGLTAKNAKFYYGYETSFCKECNKTIDAEFCPIDSDHETEWCFVAEFNNEKIVIPFGKLGVIDHLDVIECLMTGIGWILAKYKLLL